MSTNPAELRIRREVLDSAVLTISDQTRTLRTKKVKSIIRNIDLNKNTMQEFEEECARFSQEIELVMDDLTT